MLLSFLFVSIDLDCIQLYGQTCIQYPCSSISILLLKSSTFPHFAYIDDCCESLGRDKEYPTDKYLLYVIQLQQIMERTKRLSTKQGIENSYADSALELYIMTLKSDLELFTTLAVSHQ